ncbi:pyruvate, phosphate dikinase [Nitrososphaera viennensis]|uniref:pyruvate, phosphate dikinase n=2 Tax=Nitrososphaera viennensis TaxID=1034015 RepID=A0A060HQ59_9ARCH|nr:pyruvate, phosphate dikinase [Nitrososphaera viennensis]AIC15686.1 pyruvate, phosphate dikinase [Nitrososphaera viennensis EN76]UVS70559.1 pyruvate, phosphate dikinase [Nitrososphaera viennensis]
MSSAIAKPIYFFDEADGKNRALLGGKGAGLAEMTKLGLPVPPGFIITTDICEKFYEAGKRLPDGLMDEVRKSVRRLESITGKKFGDAKNPLLVSVRSGAPVSMPGMMDTILNLGLNDQTVEGLAAQSGDARFALDAYRRFIQMFGKIVLGADDRQFEKALVGNGINNNSSDEKALRQVIASFRSLCEATGKRFPDDPYKQIELAIDAVFRSWTGKRAVEYRRQYGITPDMANGTAVTVVAMVFGNMGRDSATGVVFTRNPETGEKKLYGDYLVNAQGEDVVSGKANPSHIDQLESEMPQVFGQLSQVCQKLENHFRECQDVEFTVERGRLYILQTRTAKMSAGASVKTSVDMYHEGLINKVEALQRIDPEGLEQILYPRIDSHVKQKPVATGVAASPGAASGIAVFDVAKAEAMGKRGEKVILIREDTKPDDVPAFFQSVGILTTRGGKTSHAAVVARGMGKPCVVGCSQIEIDPEGASFSVAGRVAVSEGQKITIDGSTGRVYTVEVPTVAPEITSEFKEILQWSAEMKAIRIRANADTPESATLARKYGAEGIGLCRTERMFNQHDRIALFTKMVMAETEQEREKALAELERLQKSDFKAIFKEMQGLPVTIRLLDPPLHEFLPKEEDLMMQIFELKSEGGHKAESEMLKREKMLRRVRELSEINPMLGHRGVRVGITFPEIYEMQIRAVCEAAADLTKEGVKVESQIMVPQVATVNELATVRHMFESVKRDAEHRHKIKLKIVFGSMIEVVRSCLVADEIAHVADFLSFGTNDLTQATFSFSREDAEGKFLPFYLEKGVIAVNPFQSIDQKGVGRLMKMTIEMARKVKKDMEIGICGEHGGDPKSIEFCTAIGLDYVSASSHRIPIAILAAAQSAIRGNKSKLSRFLTD